MKIQVQEYRHAVGWVNVIGVSEFASAEAAMDYHEEHSWKPLENATPVKEGGLLTKSEWQDGEEPLFISESDGEVRLVEGQSSEVVRSEPKGGHAGYYQGA